MSIETPESRHETIEALKTEVTRMELMLRASDKMAKIIDWMVVEGQLGSRSALADARLNYGEPFKYDWTKKEGE